MALSQAGWRNLYWTLLAVWVLCAALDMRHIHAGMLTDYGADLTQPAWLYIASRSLDNPARQGWVRRTVGATPIRAAALIFLGSTATEISQYFWPQGLFPGTYDPFDILAYAVGTGICFALDTR